MPSGGSCITLWEVVDYRSVSSRLCGDNAATGFWWSIRDYWWDGLRWCGKRYVSVTCKGGRISPGDDSPSPRCGNVAVVALCLLVNRKMCFYGV